MDGWLRPHALGGYEQFECVTDADPAAVWAALTKADQTPKYLYGLAAHSSWSAGAAIEFRREGFTLVGHVIHVDPPHRLSYCLSASSQDLDGPATYVTWEVSSSRERANRCRIQLQIDETERCVVDSAEDVRQTWGPVITSLQVLLAE
jgi:uncharacterized protein YndB with AHSA1/START domain